MMSYRDVVMRIKTLKTRAGNLGDLDKIVKGAQTNRLLSKNQMFCCTSPNITPRRGFCCHT